jgi:hypothetical protein
MRATVFRRWALRREVERIPVYSEASVEGSVVLVTGTVRALTELLVAPSSGRPCVAFCVRMWIGQIGDILNLDLFARTPHTIVESREFALELRSGETVTIDPVGSHLDIELPGARRLNPDRERLKSFRARHPQPGTRFRSHECVIEPGAVISVAGALVRDPQRPAGEIAFRHEPEARSRIIGDPQRSLRIVDALTGAL